MGKVSDTIIDVDSQVRPAWRTAIQCTVQSSNHLDFSRSSIFHKHPSDCYQSSRGIKPHEHMACDCACTIHCIERVVYSSCTVHGRSCCLVRTDCELFSDLVEAVRHLSKLRRLYFAGTLCWLGMSSYEAFTTASQPGLCLLTIDAQSLAHCLGMPQTNVNSSDRPFA
jgi:hypothetical protein